MDKASAHRENSFSPDDSDQTSSQPFLAGKGCEPGWHEGLPVQQIQSRRRHKASAPQ